ncbi:axonemal dynein light intermediate polypeptide 1-like isoform 5-T6 [Spinachia spinachia]
MATPSKSLVKYDRPALVSKKPAEGSGEPTCPTDAPRQEVQEILNRTFPPREWMEEDQVWRQQVSSAPFTTANVVRLKELLDRKLLQSRARETGLCPERRELYSQCLDELIRMVTIQCAERGLLLLRVRDDIQGTFAAYQTLYESGMSFGVRKMLQAELDQIYSRQNSSEMEKEKQSLRKRVKELRADIEAAKESNDERRRVKKEEREEEIEMLKSLNQQLKSQLEGMLSA